MEIFKNINDSQEMIFLQAIDQNYIDHSIDSNSKINKHELNEDYSYSDIEDFHPHINFNFIEFSDDSVSNSPNSKSSAIVENNSTSLISNDSTEAENNNTSTHIDYTSKCKKNSSKSQTENTLSTTVSSMITSRFNQQSFTNINNFDSLQLRANLEMIPQKKLSVNFFESLDIPNNLSSQDEVFDISIMNKIDFKKVDDNEIQYVIKPDKSTLLQEQIIMVSENLGTRPQENITKIKDFLALNLKNYDNLNNDINILKEKIKKEIKEKLVSNMKYFEYLKFYHMTTNRINASVINNNPIKTNNVMINHAIPNKPSLSLNSTMFVSHLNKNKTFATNNKSNVENSNINNTDMISNENCNINSIGVISNDNNNKNTNDLKDSKIFYMNSKNKKDKKQEQPILLGISKIVKSKNNKVFTIESLKDKKE